MVTPLESLKTSLLSVMIPYNAQQNDLESMKMKEVNEIFANVQLDELLNKLVGDLRTVREEQLAFHSDPNTQSIMSDIAKGNNESDGQLIKVSTRLNELRVLEQAIMDMISMVTYNIQNSRH